MTGALSGIKVVDISRVLSGPFCSQILGDMGAEVIKVEPPQGDETRLYGPPFDDHGESAYFRNINRNKRGIALNLSKAAGREVLFRMLDDADVLIENFKTGTMARWGLDFETVLSKRYPRLVYCSVSGFGDDGPLGGFPGYDAVAQAVAGIMSVNGDANSGPTRMGIPIADMSSGMFATISILGALMERQRSGQGQAIDITLYDAALGMLHPHTGNYLMSGQRPKLTGNAHPTVTPCDKFATSTGDIYIVIGNNRQFRRLMEYLGEPELGTNPLFIDNAARLTHRDALSAELARLFATKDAEIASRELLERGVPAGPVQNVGDVLEHPHTEARNLVVSHDNYRGVRFPGVLSRTPTTLRRRPPKFNEHGDEVLAEHGFSEEEIKALAEEGAYVRQMSHL